MTTILPPGRRISVEIGTPISDEKYADLANTLWMVMRSTDLDFVVHFDEQTNAQMLNESWARYSDEAAWGD